MQTLPNLKPVTKLTSFVTRVLGGNPGQYTLQGTNTYLIGPPSSLLLLDTGSLSTSPTYISHLRTALSLYSSPPKITDIVLSHWHEDHTGGLGGVLELLWENKYRPRVWKMKCEGKDGDVESVLKGLEMSIEELEEGKKFSWDDEHSLEVLATPGHTSDSISLYLSCPSSPILFTADTVLGHGTAVFTSLSSYLSSLQKCSTFLAEKGDAILYPGHGEIIQDGKNKLEEYVRHRLEREKQVLDALGAKGQTVTASDLTTLIYASTIPISLHPAATRGLLLHLEKLEIDGKVERIPSGAGGEKVGGEEEDRVVGWWDDGWKLVEEEDGKARM